MTTSAEGPSLLQAPADAQSAQKQHHHQHRHLPHVHQHQHHHPRFLQARHSSSFINHVDIRSPKEDSLVEKRVVVEETKTVVQNVDDTAAVISVSTTSLTTGSAVSALAASATATNLTAPTSSTAPSTGLDSSAAASLSVSSGISLALEPTSLISAPVTTSTLSSLASLNSSSVPSSTFSTTTSSPSVGSNITVSWTGGHYSNSTDISSLYSHPSTELGRTLFHESTQTSSSPTFATVDGSGATSSPGVGGGGTDGNGSSSGASAASTVTSQGDSDGSGLTEPEKSAIIAVSGLACVAILSFLLLLFLKWKKRQGGSIRLLSAMHGRGVPGPADSGPSPPAQLRSVPLVLPRVLGSRGGAGRSTHERGFQRISGRKLLQSAVESGGDGYSDPRHPPQANNLSKMDGISHAAVRDSLVSQDGDSLMYNRASCVFPDGPSRFQLNSPIRPASGEVFVRSSPARTPLQELSPFADPAPQTPPLGPPPKSPLLTPPSAQYLPASNGRSSGGPHRTEAIDLAAVSSSAIGPLAPQSLPPSFREGV